MTFGQAMVALERGERVRRSGWYREDSATVSVVRVTNDGVTSYRVGGNIYLEVPFYPDQIDMRATDWEVVE